MRQSISLRLGANKTKNGYGRRFLQLRFFQGVTIILGKSCSRIGGRSFIKTMKLHKKGNGLNEKVRFLSP